MDIFIIGAENIYAIFTELSSENAIFISGFCAAFGLCATSVSLTFVSRQFFYQKDY